MGSSSHAPKAAVLAAVSCPGGFKELGMLAGFEFWIVQQTQNVSGGYGYVGAYQNRRALERPLKHV